MKTIRDMKKDVLSGIVLVFSLIILFSLFLSGAVSADGCPECSGSLSSGRCADVGVSTCGGTCSSTCHVRTYCDDYSSGYRTCTSTDNSCTDNCCSAVDCVWGGWSVCNSSGLQTRAIATAASCYGSACTGPSIRSCTYLNTPYFANLSEPNSVASSADLGDTIYLRFGGENINSSTSINYKVEAKEETSWRNLWGLLGRSWNSFSLISGKAYEPYVINDSNNHRLNASAQGEGIWKQSSELTIHAYNNSMPVAQIISPLDNSNWSVNFPLNFTHSSYDGDDLLEVTWDFGDGTNYTVYNYSLALTPGLGNTQHIYTALGVYTVTFTAKEMPTRTNPQSVVVKRTIYVFKEGVNVFPIITSPVKGVQYGNFVNFDASQSFVANCSATLAGYSFIAGNLQCKYLHAPGTRDVASGHNLSVAWNIYSGINGALSSKMGNWQTNYSQVVEFTNYFANADTHEAVLMLDYN